MKRDELRTIASLSWELFSRDMVSRYRASRLGYVWLLVTPLAVASAWIFLKQTGNLTFAYAGTSYVAYVTTGVFLWQGFTRQVQSSLAQLSGSRHLFSKYLFPWEAVVLAGWAETLLEFVVTMAVLLVVLGITGSISAWGLLLSIPWILSLLLLGSGLGLLAAPFGLLYEDIGRAISLGLQLMFFLIPIVYVPPTTSIGRMLVEYNPIAVLLIAARDEILLGQGTLFYQGIVASVLAVGLIGIGFAILRVARPYLAVTAN